MGNLSSKQCTAAQVYCKVFLVLGASYKPTRLRSLKRILRAKNVNIPVSVGALQSIETRFFKCFIKDDNQLSMSSKMSSCPLKLDTAL